MSVRLSLARRSGFVIPGDGELALFAPTPGVDLAPLGDLRLHVIQSFRPYHDHFRQLGIDASPAAEGRFDAAIVFATRSKALARSLIWQAADLTDGPIAVDGVKSDGIDSLYKAVRKRVPVGEPVNKAHGKTFWFDADTADFADWKPAFQTHPEGWMTWPGVFSADGPDPASVLLAASLPKHLGRHVVDLGAGWGYLSAGLLGQGETDHLDLVEADRMALDCARRNLSDPRVAFHWADARGWKPTEPADAVVMNPPFHSGRAADTGLGQAFVAAAAGMLKQSGVLWMVANRHLPYESVLSERFREYSEIAGDNRFKVIRAARPSRARP